MDVVRSVIVLALGCIYTFDYSGVRLCMGVVMLRLGMYGRG